MNGRELYDIVIVEDDPGEQKLLKLLLKDTEYIVNPFFLSDGEEAINYFKSLNDEKQKAQKIDLILLDLNLPKINGSEVLKYIKSTPHLRRIPVVVLTTSANNSDVLMSYDNGAAGFIRKPTVFEEYRHVFKNMLHYWFQVCIIP